AADPLRRSRCRPPSRASRRRTTRRAGPGEGGRRRHAPSGRPHRPDRTERRRLEDSAATGLQRRARDSARCDAGRGAYSSPMTERLDEQKLAQVRAWADSLLADERPELRAAARGLLMMADEVELLWVASRTAVAADIGSALADRRASGAGGGGA